MNFRFLANAVTWAVYCHAHFQPSVIPPTFEDRSSPSADLTALTVQIPIDHFNNKDDRTYANRYWINASHYEAGGPVFFYDVGESAVTTNRLYNYLGERTGSSSVMSLARRYHGLVVIWEHRYYGGSLPSPSRPDARAETYEYLTTEQALEDVVFFANHFTPEGLKEHWRTLKPSLSPWIWIGGSYPGSRGAFLRLRNPEVIYASWSSSASVQASLDLPEYYAQVGRDIPRACSTVIRDAITYFDHIMTKGTRIQQTQLRFDVARSWPQSSLLAALIFAATGTSYNVAAYLRSVVSSDYQWAGMDGFMGKTCEILNPLPVRSDITPSQIMILPTNLEAPPQHNKNAFKTLLKAIHANLINFQDTNPDRSHEDEQAWQWQVCTEHGFFQTASPGSRYNLLSSFLNIDEMWANDCALNFPGLSFPPNSSVLLKYGGWRMNPSNVMFTNGLRDPWHNAGLQSPSFKTGSPNRTTTSKVPACNIAPPGDEVFGLVYPYGYHTGDFLQNGGPSDGDATQALDLFEHALDEWLPCFQDSKDR